MLRRHFIVFVLLISFFGCKKETINFAEYSSLKIFENNHEPKQVQLTKSLNGNLLVTVCSADNFAGVVFSAELILLNNKGELIKNITFSDTAYQYVNAVPASDGGFFLVASTAHENYFSVKKINEVGNVIYTRNIVLSSGENKNSIGLCNCPDGNYLIIYQAVGNGYYVSKFDRGGFVIFNIKLPNPVSIHQGTGLNYGEKYVNIYQPADSLIVLQGVTYDQYNETIENCFIRELHGSMTNKWFSSNYDPTHFEIGSGFGLSTNQQLIFFGTISDHAINEYYGNPIARIYNSSGNLNQQIIFPQVDGTNTLILKTISTPDGGFLMVGSNNQSFTNDVVSNNHLILTKLNNDLSIAWNKTLSTYYPSKGFDAVYLNDGTIGIAGLIKDNLSTNRILYLHMDSNGKLIQ